MTIKNDTFVIGTTAVAAGTANIIAQKKDTIKTALDSTKDAIINGAKATIKKDTYTKAASRIREGAKATVKKDTYKVIGDKVANAAKKAIKTETYKNAFETLSNKLTSVNWKSVGKYAGVAALVATAAVVAKNILFPSKDEA